MKKLSVLAIVFLVLCVGAILLMRSCGGSRPEEPSPIQTLETDPPATPAPTEPPVSTEPVVTPPPAVSATGTFYTTDDVNMRRAPTNGEVITVVPKGTAVEKTGEESGWASVKLQGVEGYISSDYLSPQPPADAAATGASGADDIPVTPCSDTVWTTDGVNLRRGPGTNYEIAGSVDKNTQLSRTGTTANGWSRVLYQSVGYYVSSDYVTTTAPATETPTPTGGESESGSQTGAAPADAPALPTSGEFKSSTGTGLELIVRWSVLSSDENTKTLQFYAYLSSGTLQATASADDLCFKVGNDTFNTTSYGAEVSSKGLTETLLGACSCIVNQYTLPVTVTWHFNGTYGGHQIDDIEATDTLVLGS